MFMYFFDTNTLGKKIPIVSFSHFTYKGEGIFTTCSCIIKM
jgi:hypothetical protein